MNITATDLQRHLRVLLTILAAGAALTGCFDRSMSDLESYANEVLARKGTGVDPLPPVKLPEGYTYQCVIDDCVDPFEPFFKEPDIDTGGDSGGTTTGGGGPSPDFDRNKEELETSPLDGLRMMGTLESNDELWGIVRSPDGVIHRVQVGNYMGRNHGKIIGIMEERIDLTEIIPDGQGGWMEREASLALIE